MHPFIIQSIAAEHARNLQETAKHSRDARLARDRYLPPEGLTQRTGRRASYATASSR
jgi:hypothetical protein